MDTNNYRKRGAVVVVGLCLLLCAGGLYPDVLLPALRYERAGITSGEWWRLLSAHFVHIDAWHAVLNAAALPLIVWLGANQVSMRQWLWLGLASIVAVDAGLYSLAPGIPWYAGASGALHGLFAGMSLLLGWRGREPIGTLMLLLLVAKLSFEQLAGYPSPWTMAAGFKVVTESHLFGALGGLAGAIALQATAAARARSRP